MIRTTTTLLYPSLYKNLRKMYLNLAFDPTTGRHDSVCLPWTEGSQPNPTQPKPPTLNKRKRRPSNPEEEKGGKVHPPPTKVPSLLS